MRIDFPYPGYESIAPADVPDANLMGVFAPRTFPDTNETSVLSHGFEHPFNAPPLREAVTACANGGGRVLILIDDGTRQTPVARVLPKLIEELHAGGVRDKDITF